MIFLPFEDMAIGFLLSRLVMSQSVTICTERNNLIQVIENDVLLRRQTEDRSWVPNARPIPLRNVAVQLVQMDLGIELR